MVGANAMVDVRGKKIRGRQYPWGVIEVENPLHCDFVKLRTMLITHMQDLQVGLYRTSRPVRKSGKISNSGLSRNRTFSFPDAGLLTLLKIEKKSKFSKWEEVSS